MSQNKKPKTFDRTNKEHARGLSVNEIYHRFTQTRQIPQSPVPPQFLNAMQFPSDLITHLNLKRDIDEYFQKLPSQIRTNFQNNSINLVTFLANPENHASAEKMGLIKKPEKPSPQLGTIQNPVMIKPVEPAVQQSSQNQNSEK